MHLQTVQLNNQNAVSAANQSSQKEHLTKLPTALLFEVLEFIVPSTSDGTYLADLTTRALWHVNKENKKLEQAFLEEHPYLLGDFLKACKNQPEKMSPYFLDLTTKVVQKKYLNAPQNNDAENVAKKHIHRLDLSHDVISLNELTKILNIFKHVHELLCHETFLDQACFTRISEETSLQSLEIGLYGPRYLSELPERQYIPVGSLQNLQKLDLSNRTVTNETMQEIGTLSQLKELRLHRTGLESPMFCHIGKLVGLQVLDVSTWMNRTFNDSAFSHLKNLGELSTLNISGNDNLTNAAFEMIAKNHPQLTSLDLSETLFANPESLLVLKQLRELFLRKTRINSDGLADIANNHPLLEKIDLSKNPAIVDLSFLNSLSNLEELYVDECHVNPHNFFRYAILPRNLRSLSYTLSKNVMWLSHASRQDLESLSALHELTSLNLSRHKFKEPFPTLHKLSTLTLEECSFDNPKEALISLGNMQTVTSLNVRGCGVDDEILEALTKKLVRLEHLDLTNNPITLASIQKLAHLPRLLSLALGGKLITDDFLKEISICLPNLRFLALHNAQFTEQGLALLEKMRLLRSIDITPMSFQTHKTQELMRLFPKLNADFRHNLHIEVPRLLERGAWCAIL